MNTLKPATLASILALSSVLALGACSKKADTAPAAPEPAAPAATTPTGDAASAPVTAAAATAATAAARTKTPDGAKVYFVG
ncbi:MAG: hypothetical protein JWR16_3367, partial [Nevskia sp.]|nr:hypothetical protein [Nevskia sp.]